MDSSEEPRGIFLVIDNKSFYATVECTMRGLDPLTTPLVVMSEAENTNGGLVLASSPMAKKLYDISNVNRQRDLPILHLYSYYSYSSWETINDHPNIVTVEFLDVV